MLKLRRIAAGSLNLWKREMKMARMAPFSSSSGEIQKANRQIATPPLSDEKAKSSIFEKLQSLISETLDLMMREEEKKGVSVTKEDLVGWAERLNKEGKHEYALEIFEWMDKKKMDISPKELALFVELIAKVKGVFAADDYFEKVDPDFSTEDPHAKNWPAYLKLRYIPRPAVVRRRPGGRSANIPRLAVLCRPGGRSASFYPLGGFQSEYLR